MSRTRLNGPALGRKAATKSLAPTHVVFCEGSTEKHCLESLRQHHRMPSVQVHVVDCGAEPGRVVREAAARLKELRRTTPDARVHVVFDRDEHPHFKAAVDQARQLGLHLGVSNPCFELWAMLLHVDQTASLDTSEAQHRLKQLHPGYCHHRNPRLDRATVLANLPAARRRARALAERARSLDEPLPNPCTTFHELVDAIFPSAP
jgi:hypothetical protein